MLKFCGGVEYSQGRDACHAGRVGAAGPSDAHSSPTATGSWEQVAVGEEWASHRLTSVWLAGAEEHSACKRFNLRFNPEEDAETRIAFKKPALFTVLGLGTNPSPPVRAGWQHVWTAALWRRRRVCIAVAEYDKPLFHSNPMDSIPPILLTNAPLFYLRTSVRMQALIRGDRLSI